MNKFHLICISLIIVQEGLLCSSFNSFSQTPTSSGFQAGQATEKGYLPIINYSQKDYHARPQNWAITQDNSGIMYFGNNWGVLEYDGVRWRLIDVTNDKVRSLASDTTGRIYVGVIGEFGYLLPDSTGKLGYRSLLENVNEADREFGEVKKIIATNNKVYFQTSKKVFLWDGNAITVWTAETSFWSMFYVNETMYIQQKDIGLMKLANNTLIDVQEGGIFFNKLIIAMLSTENSNVLIATEQNSMFSMHYDAMSRDTAISNISTTADNLLLENRLRNGIDLGNNTFSIGTWGNGVMIIDQAGRIIHVLKKNSGLQDEIIQYQYLDREGNLWLALSKGITKIDIRSPITFYNDQAGLEGTVQSITRYKGTLYVSTVSGLYYLSGKRKTTTDEQTLFIPVKGISMPCWDMLSFSEGEETILLLALDDGIYRLGNNRSPTPITNNYPWVLHQSREDPMRVFIGLDDGLASIYRNNGKWVDEGKWDGINEQIRSIAEDVEGMLWLGTTNQGILTLNTRKLPLDTVITRYDTSNSLPEGVVFAQRAMNRIVLTTDNGLFSPKEYPINFVSDTTLGTRFGNGSCGIHRLKEDNKGNIWMVTTSDEKGVEIGFVKPTEDGSFSWNSKQFFEISDDVVNGIYNDENGVTWLGGPDGLFRYEGNIEKSYERDFNTQIRKVVLNEDSVIFWGSFLEKSGAIVLNQSERKIPVLSYINNSITLEFAAQSYVGKSPNQYSHYLEGFEKEWTIWNDETKSVYTNLPEGTYYFRVKAKNIHQKESNEAVYQFTILPPWYRTWWAYALYILSGIGVIVSVVYLNLNRLMKAKKRLEKLVKERTHELVEKNIELDKLSIVARETDNYVIISDKDDKIEWVNAGFSRITGYELSEVLGKTPSSILGGDLTNTEEIEKLNAAIKDKKPVTAEILNYTKENEPIWLYANVTPVVNANGRITRIIAVGSDITEKKKTEEKIKQQNIELEKLSIVASETDNSVFIMNEKCELEWVNQAFTRLQGFTLEEFVGERGSSLFEISGNPEIKSILRQIMDERKSSSYESVNITKDNKEIWFQTTLTPIFGPDEELKKVVAIDSDITDLKKAEEEIQHKSEEITDSINYAKNIQYAILPLDEDMNNMLPNHFVLFMPKDIVSGDFYWATQMGDTAFYCAADCTGHGVPGAFMSMICSSQLNETVGEKGITKPAEIFFEVRKGLISHLQQTGEGQKDGMDAIICALTKTEESGAKAKLSFACANNPLFIIRESTKTNLNLESTKSGESEVQEIEPVMEDNGLALFEIKADKQPVGILFGDQLPFTNHEVMLDKGDLIYAISDGFQDQFGGPKGRKFMIKRLKKLFLEIGSRDLEVQKEMLHSALEEWKAHPENPDGESEQVDDVLVIGVRV